MPLALKTAPASEPLTTAEAKTFLRVDHTADDSLIDSMIAAARQMAEDYTGRAFITQTWTLWLDRFPRWKEPWWDGVVEAHMNILNGNARSEIALPRPPLVSVTHLKTYDDYDNASTFDADSYTVDSAGSPGRIVLETGYVWPTDLRRGNAIEIEFVAGYGNAAAVPAAIKMAIYNIVAAMYEQRGCDVEMPKHALRLLAPYRILHMGEING